MKCNPITPLAVMAVGIGLAFAGVGVAQSGKAGKKRAGVLAPEIAYKVGSNARVGITAVTQGGKRVPLTYSDSGGTSTTVVMVNSRALEYGSKLGEWRQKPIAFTSKEGIVRHGHWAAWSVGKITITQIVEIVPSETGRLDTCLVYYTLENGDNNAHEVGIRAMIDTMIAHNDGNSFGVAGRTVIDFADFREPKDVPGAFEVREKSDPDEPGFIAWLTPKVGGDILPPDRCTLTHWPGVSTAWTIPVRNMEADSAVALYWNPRQLEPGAVLHVGYAYGLGVLNLSK